MAALTRTLNTALDNMELSDQDQPLAELARIYARKLEFNPTDETVLKSVGPELLKTLAELMMTPKARAAITQQVKEVASDDPEATAFIGARAAAKSRYGAHSSEDLHSPTP